MEPIIMVHAHQLCSFIAEGMFYSIHALRE